jgi:hypothetical protein
MYPEYLEGPQCYLSDTLHKQKGDTPRICISCTIYDAIGISNTIRICITAKRTGSERRRRFVCAGINTIRDEPPRTFEYLITYGLTSSFIIISTSTPKHTNSDAQGKQHSQTESPDFHSTSFLLSARFKNCYMPSMGMNRVTREDLATATVGWMLRLG